MTEHGQSVRPPQKLTPQALSAIRRELGESKARFGFTLKRIISPRALRGFSRQYIHRLEAGDPKTPITPAIARAALVLAAMLDGQDEVQARARKVEVLAVNDIEGAVVRGEKKSCALAGCRVWFVGHPQQRYHALTCKREAARRRRVAERQNGRPNRS